MASTVALLYPYLSFVVQGNAEITQAAGAKPEKLSAVSILRIPTLYCVYFALTYILQAS